jgi:hypothetical protein
MRKAIQLVFRGLAIVAALMATVQPILGSFAFFRGGDAIDYEPVHLIVGGILYNAALLLAILAWFTQFRRRLLLLVVCIALYGLTHLQLRLGLGSNEDGSLLAYHIPVGVLNVLVAYLTVALGFGGELEPSRA